MVVVVMVYSSYNIIEIHCHFTASLSFLQSLTYMLMFAQYTKLWPIRVQISPKSATVWSAT